MRKLVLVTVGIWAVGIGSAAALVTTLARKPVPVVQEALARESGREEPVADIERFKVPGPLVVAAPKLRAQIRMPGSPAKRKMRCSGFKPMQIGPIDHGVRYCE
jgi:hypothetical protein